jgi:hypothetical protein
MRGSKFIEDEGNSEERLNKREREREINSEV